MNERGINPSLSDILSRLESVADTCRRSVAAPHVTSHHHPNPNGVTTWNDFRTRYHYYSGDIIKDICLLLLKLRARWFRNAETSLFFMSMSVKMEQ
jgi:hypothetical protein